MIYTVYILHSNIKDRYYIGYTGEDIIERVRKHNTNHKGFTGGTGDWIVVYQEIYFIKSEAIKREREIKNWKSRKAIVSLIGR
ncbi:MAG: GIY-YIG nuclease family protein [Ferruginibacter sp.]